MDFSEALELWQENQLRIVVLASLAIQWFLFFFAPFRQRQIHGLLRFFIWLAYLGSDAAAIYGLAIIVNSRRCDHRGHPVLELMWAPILLVHLSGQDSITAYNIEDNELWRRHILTAASQVAAAIYVFVKSWPKPNVTTTHLVVDPTTTDWVEAIRAHKEEKRAYMRIFTPALLVLYSGIAMCFLKPWELKRVSVNSLVDSSGSEENGESTINSLQEYVGAARQYFDALPQRGRRLLQPINFIDLLLLGSCVEVWKPYNLCVDLAPPYSVRLRCLKLLVRIDPDTAHRLVKSKLSATFHQLYTKESLKPQDILHMDSGGPGRFHLRIQQVWPLPLAIVGLHNKVRGIGQDPTDVTITYALLCSALVMKVWPMVIQNNTGHQTWPDQVAQYNLMGYVARSKKHSWLMKVVAWLGFKGLVDQLWTKKPRKGASSKEITGLVHAHVRRGWTEGHIAGAESFRAFNDYRGQWTLKREVAGIGRSIPSVVLKSVSRPFDESVLVWHLATDFCFHLLQDHEDAWPCSAARRCQDMSNYMMYLLFVKPEMLMPGARRNLFRDACGDLVEMLQEDRSPTPRRRGRRVLANKVIQLLKRDGDDDGVQGSAGGSLVRQAWSVAEELMDSHRGDEEKMWTVIQGVWVEMLCFSAGRCRGFLHAKSLGTGGEYLSYVWLLLLYMGMETLAEKMQRTELYDGPTAAEMSISGQNV